MLLFRQHQVDSGMISINLSFLRLLIFYPPEKYLPEAKKPRPAGEAFSTT
jgi:hypothetical protein